MIAREIHARGCGCRAAGHRAETPVFSRYSCVAGGARPYWATREPVQLFLKSATFRRGLVFEGKLTQPLHVGRNRVDRPGFIGDLKAACRARDCFHSELSVVCGRDSATVNNDHQRQEFRNDLARAGGDQSVRSQAHHDLKPHRPPLKIAAIAAPAAADIKRIVTTASSHSLNKSKVGSAHVMSTP